MREFFTTGCDSCRKKRPIDFPEASCGAYAPRCPRVSMGSLLGSHAYAHCGIAIPRLATGATDSGFSPQLTHNAVYLSLINDFSNLEEAQDARFVYNRMR